MKVRTFIGHCPMSDVQVEMKQDGCVSGGVSNKVIQFTEEEIRGSIWGSRSVLRRVVFMRFFGGFLFGVIHWDSSSGNSALGDSYSGIILQRILQGIHLETSRGCSRGFQAMRRCVTRVDRT